MLPAQDFIVVRGDGAVAMSPGAESLAILATLMALGHKFSCACTRLFAGLAAPTGIAQALQRL